MACTPLAWDDPTNDPLPYVRGLYRLIPEARLAAILTRTARASERRTRSSTRGLRTPSRHESETPSP